MKKQLNVQTLKEVVNSSALERVELCRYGVQAYNIARGEEYAVIKAYAKQGGRYYFIDREGRRFLASHYDRAEWLAGELLEVIAEDRAAAMHAAEQLERSGSVLVCADLLALFFEECDRRNIQATSTAAAVDDLGRMLTRYDLVKDDEPAQQEDNNNENNEGNQTTAEPSRIAQAAAKVAASVKAYAAKGARRVAFLLSLVLVAVLSVAALLGSVFLLVDIISALGITAAAGVVLYFLGILGPAFEIALNVEANALAVVGRLFPGFFPGRRPSFGLCSFWLRAFNE